MSYFLHPIIRCDFCKAEAPAGYRYVPSGDGKTRTKVPKFRKELARLGWSNRPAPKPRSGCTWPPDGHKHKGRRDYCPACTSKQLWRMFELK